MNAKRLYAAGLLVLLLVLAVAPLAAAMDLPSWREPLRGQLIQFAQQAATPGSAGFIPPERRIAAFDLDGTLMCEKPHNWGARTAMHWLRQNCGSFAGQGPAQAGLCRATATGDKQYLLKHIDDWLSLPFMGMSLEDLRVYSLKVFKTVPNAANGLPQSRLVYQPQIELIDFLHAKGFKVYVCSGTAVCMIQFISRKYLHVPPSRCIGTRYGLTVSEKDGRLVFRRGYAMKDLVNLGKVKAINLRLATVHGPVLAFGNSGGDAWMLRYAASQPQGMALLLNHDDPREFVYSKGKALALAKKLNWTVVSMKRDWVRVFK